MSSFCVKLPEASSMSDGPNAVSPKTDPLLAKAEPISDSGNTSEITYLQRGKNPVCNCSQRKSENM